MCDSSCAIDSYKYEVDAEPDRQFLKGGARCLLKSGTGVYADVVPRGGIEPPTRGFSIDCSTETPVSMGRSEAPKKLC